MAVIRNTGSGSWLSASTWNTGTIPTPQDNVDVGSRSGPHNTVVDLVGTGAAGDLSVFDRVNLVNGALDVGGSNKFVEGTVRISGTINLDAASKMGAAQLKIFDHGLVLDAGSIILSGFGNNRPALDNNGTMVVSGKLLDTSTSLFFNDKNGLFVVTDSGFAEFSVSGIHKKSGVAAINHGDIVASDGGRIVFNGMVTGDGSLLVQNRAEIDVAGRAADKGGALLVGEQTTLKLLGGGSLDVEFAMGVHQNDHLFLDHSQQYKGSIAGFAKGDTIDVLDQAFNVPFSTDAYHPGSHTLQVGSTNIKIVGTYTASDFTFASDLHGGTLIGHV